MSSLLPILIAGITAMGLIIILMTFFSRKNSGQTNTNGKARRKNRNVIVRDCTRKLNHDPHNVSALTELGEIFYEEGNYEKAYQIYSLLFSLQKMHREIDPAKTSARYGISAFYTGKYDEALMSLREASKFSPDSFEILLFSGRAFYELKDYEKSAFCLKRAYAVNREHLECSRYLGLCLFNMKKYREALPFLKKVLDEDPTNKEILFNFATALDESQMGDKALKIFTHLRADPIYGPPSCLACGIMHAKKGNLEQAVQDYEIALKLDTINPETKLMLYYKAAQAYLQQNNISKALNYLKQIQLITPNYKDVSILISRYQELNQNKNLQKYIMASTSDFVALCRRFITIYYSGSNVKIDDLQVHADSVDILCHVVSAKWEENELFRFFRGSAAIGDLYIRSFHSKMRDIKVDRGFCVTAGTYTEECHRYIEGRPIDLIEKGKLVAVLKKIDSPN